MPLFRTTKSIHPARALGALLAAGISPAQAAASLRDHKDIPLPVRRKLEPAARLLTEGKSFVEAFGQTGLFQRYELEILRVSEIGGQLPQALTAMADRVEKAQARISTLRARFALPAAVLVIAMLAGTVLGAFRNGPQAVTVLGNLVTLLVVYVLTRWLMRLVTMDGLAWAAVFWQLGLTRRFAVCRRQFEYYWYDLFMAMAEAGVDFQAALNGMIGLIKVSSYQAQARSAHRQLGRGTSLSQALSDNGLILTEELRLVVHVGERSGRLSEAIRQHLAVQQRSFEVLVQSLDDWLPRAYYLVVLVVAVRAFH